MFQEEYTSQTQKLKELQNYYAKFIQNVKFFFYSLQQKTLTPIFNFLYQNYTQKIKNIYSIDEILSILNQRIGKLIKSNNVRKNWNRYDIILLLWFLSKYMEKNNIDNPQFLQMKDWQFISNLIPGFSPKSCLIKFVSLQKTKLKLINWSKQEQNLLIQLVKKYGVNAWKEISEELYFKDSAMKVYRSPKQCRQHWNCFLDPNLKKGPWSQEQDIKLLLKIKVSKGLKKWCNIKYCFEGRTQNALKNRYNLLIEKRKRFFPNKQQEQIIDEYLKQKYIRLTDYKQNIQSQNFSSEQVHQNEKSKNFVDQNQNIQKLSTNQIMNSFKSSFQISSKFLNKLQNQQNNLFQSKNYINLGSKVIKEFTIQKLKDKQQKINYYQKFQTRQTKSI